jgi:hypothetical protein
MQDLFTGRKVYILGKGYGHVREIGPDGTFRVLIENHGCLGFNADGTQGTSSFQRVYLENPVVVEPVRNQPLWRLYVHLSQMLFTELCQIRGEEHDGA